MHGWGAHAFGALACGKWSPCTQALSSTGRLSINPLELLASAAAVMLLNKMGKWPGTRQIALIRDNATAGNAANTGIAYRPAMRLALGIYVDICKTTSARRWLVHVGTKENRIADLASRQERNKVEVAICEARWNPRWTDISKNMHEWERQMQQWARINVMLDEVCEADEDIASEMKEVELLNLELRCNTH